MNRLTTINDRVATALVIVDILTICALPKKPADALWRGYTVLQPSKVTSTRVITSVSYTLQTGSDVNLLRTSNPAAITPLKLTGNAAAQTIQGNAGANGIDGGGGLDDLHPSLLM